MLWNKAESKQHPSSRCRVHQRVLRKVGHILQKLCRVHFPCSWVEMDPVHLIAKVADVMKEVRADFLDHVKHVNLLSSTLLMSESCVRSPLFGCGNCAPGVRTTRKSEGVYSPEAETDPHLRTSQKDTRASLVAQWLRVCLPMQGTRVRALVQEDPTCCKATKAVRHNY